MPLHRCFPNNSPTFDCLLQNNLKRHIDLHFSSRCWKCTLCGAAFHAKKTLETHIVYKHQEKREFKCSECSLVSDNISFVLTASSWLILHSNWGVESSLPIGWSHGPFYLPPWYKVSHLGLLGVVLWSSVGLSSCCQLTALSSVVDKRMPPCRIKINNVFSDFTL